MNEPEHLTGFADVVAVSTDNGELRVRVGDAGTGQGFAGGIPCYGPDGFIGIPNLPTDDGKAAQAIYFYDGNRKICVGTRDNRFAANIGTGEPGDRMIVSDCDARFFLKRESNMVALYTVNEDEDLDMMMSLDGSSGQMLMQNAGAFVKVMKDSIDLVINGGASIKMNGGVVQIICGNFQVVCDGNIQLGSIAPGVPVQPIPTNAVAISQAGPVNTVSSKVYATV